MHCLLKKQAKQRGLLGLFGSTLDLAEVKKLLRRDLQHLAELEYHVEGHTHIAQLNGADVAAINVHQLSQFHLGEPLAVVHYIQSEFFV